MTNLDVANQISNNGAFECFQLEASIFLTSNGAMAASDKAAINALIRNSLIEVKINKVDTALFPLTKLLTPLQLSTLTNDIDNYKTFSGAMKLNIPWSFGVGQAFKFNLIGDMDSQVPVNLAIKFNMLGILDLSQDVAS